MELKVWVEGIQRIVCGVSDATTCQDVVYALAHATGKTGRFTLVEKWRSNERLLPPNEHPLRVLSKWGEYASDVQLVLRRSGLDPKVAPDGGLRANPDPFGGFVPQASGAARQGSKVAVASCANGHLKKSLTFSAGSAHHVGEPPAFREPPKERRDWSEVPRGVVKGVPQQQTTTCPPKEGETSPPKGLGADPSCPANPGVKEAGHDWSCRSAPTAAHASGPGCTNLEPAVRTCKTADAGHLGHYRPAENPGPGPPPGPRILRPPEPTGPAHHPEQNGTEVGPAAGHYRSTSQEPGGPSQGGGQPRAPVGMRLSEPPASGQPQQMVNQYGGPGGHYRSPTGYHPPPTTGPGTGTVLINAKEQLNPAVHCPTLNYLSAARTGTNPNPVPIHLGTPKSRRNLLSEFKRHDLEEELRDDSFLGRGHQERVVYDARYRDLVRLVNLQREKLTHQQADMTQYDAEISYWEEKQKDHQRQIEVIEREMQRSEFSGRDVDDQIAHLDKLHLDDELDIGRQQEKMLQSELTLLRSKLANCETEVLQCKNKMRLLMDDISEDRRWLSKEEDERKQKEMSILNDIEELQRDIQDVVKAYDSRAESCDKLDADVRRLEAAILEKKKQIESLVQEMKEANLESLTFTPSEEIRHLLEGGGHKGPGSSRKIVGSPRQLENAVPTSKNPHGVWV